MNIVGRENIKFLHIGADEIFNLACCPKCKLFVAETNSHVLFAKFVTKVTKKLSKIFNSKQDKSPIRFICWDDMFRGWSTSELDKLKVNNKNMLEPCLWNYSGDRG